MEAADEMLARLCDDLRLLRAEAGGPSLRALADAVGLGKSQLGDILNGRVGRLPDWQVVRGVVDTCHRYAHAQGRTDRLTLRAGIDEYWRPRHSAVEHLLSQNPAAGRERRTAPRQLPPGLRQFVGRRAELATLTAAAGPVVITGAAGVGKTALAVFWAHSAADRFPDGQLYVNLRGFDPSGAALTPAEAIGGLLEALGVPADQVPDSPAAQAGLYRSRLARRRVLVVLDNARDADQVRPLLPGAPGCLAVVTSRSQLTGLVVTDGAQVLRLDLLSAAESTELLAGRIGADRVAAESAAAARLVTACARLPLALSVVASRAAIQPALSLAELAAQLADEPLDAVRTGDGATDLRAVFSWSYGALRSGSGRLLRLLGLVRSDDLSLAAAASLAGVPTGQARRDLTELVDAGLLAEPVPGRYALHDLLRAYAGELAQASDPPGARRAALGRLFDHYLHTAHRAAVLLHPPFSDIVLAPARPGASAATLADRRAAHAWFDAERSALLAELRHAADAADDRPVWQLAWSMSGYLDRGAHWQEWHAVTELAVRVARCDGDLTGQAHAYRDLARVCSRLGRHDDAYGHLKRAVDQFALVEDLAGLAHTHLILGQVLERSGRHRAAVDESRRALALFTAAGCRAGQAYALNAVGWQLALLGDFHAAISYCRRALYRLRDVADRQGEADTWDSLGYAHHNLGDHTAAADCYRRAVAMFRADGDRYAEASTLNNLADSQHALGDAAATRTARETAWTILREIGHRDADRVRERLDRPAA